MNRIVALDETGQFTRKSGISYIGGYIVDAESVQQEEKAIENLLKSICEEFNKSYLEKEHKKYQVLYPKSLHCSDRNETFFIEENISNSVIPQKKWLPVNGEGKEVKGDIDKFLAFLTSKLIEYMKQNKYTLYAFIDPYVKAEGYNEVASVKSNLMDLEQGANLYERMAILSVYNNVFYSLEEKAEEYIFELATRTLNNTDDSWSDLYEVYTNNSGARKSTITNTSTYKTALTTMLYEKDEEELYRNGKYKFNVKSINYNREDRETTPFQYAADIVCRYILEKLRKQFVHGERTLNIPVTGEGLIQLSSEEDIQLRIYDECDTLFRGMVDAVKKADIVAYYAKCYEMELSTARYKEFYLKYWIPRLDIYFRNSLSVSQTYKRSFEGKIPEYIVAVNGYMGIREKAYEKGLYIAKKMVALVEELKSYRGRNSALFELYDVILRGYNHRGAIAKTKEYIEKCEIYKAYIGIESYIAHTLRTMEFYFNSLDYEQALKAGLELDKAVTQLKSAYMSCYRISGSISLDIVESGNEAENFQFKLAGKLWSSIGQACGFLKKYSSGQRYFMKALNEFGKRSDDYLITMSHYLHLLIASNKKNQYEFYAETYFGSAELVEQMNNAFSSNNAFSLLIFVKAFNVFYIKDRSNINVFYDLIKGIKGMEIGREHPWELIYKNLYECVLKQKKQLEIKDYLDLKEKALSCIPMADVTIKMIQIHAKMTFLEEEGEDVQNYFVVDCLNEDEIKICSLFKENVQEMTFLELKEYLDEKMVYAYR